jgi:hypothetical protein
VCSVSMTGGRSVPVGLCVCHWSESQMSPGEHHSLDSDPNPVRRLGKNKSELFRAVKHVWSLCVDLELCISVCCLCWKVICRCHDRW